MSRKKAHRSASIGGMLRNGLAPEGAPPPRRPAVAAKRSAAMHLSGAGGGRGWERAPRPLSQGPLIVKNSKSPKRKRRRVRQEKARERQHLATRPSRWSY